MFFLSLLLTRLFAYAPDEGAGGGTTTPESRSGAPDKAAQDQSAGDNPDGEGDHEGEQQPPEMIPLDKLSKRLDRARREGVSDLLKTLGVDDAEALKTLVESEQKRREGELTELQKAQRDLTRLTKDRDTLQERYETLRESVRADRLMAGITVAAPTAKHPEDVVAWARQHAAEALAAVQDEDGQVDPAKAKALVNKCLKARPEYFNAETPGVPSNSGARTPGTHEQVKRAAETAVRQAKSFL